LNAHAWCAYVFGSFKAVLRYRHPMARKKANRIATEVWEQMFAGLAKREHATMWNPDFDRDEAEQDFRESLKGAGWAEREIEARIQMERTALASAPTTSPGVNPHAEVIFGRLCSDVEAAMERLQLTSHASIARGIEPRLFFHAAKTNVILSDESIITVGAQFFRFCGLVARALTRTLNMNPYFWESADWTEEKARMFLRTSPELLRYWMMIFLSYATSGTNAQVPFKPATRREALLFEQVARAMELFAVAHEYGHHDLRHGKEPGSDPHKEEFEADQFALRICYEIERFPFIYDNPYLSSGAGGVVLLLGLEMLKTVENTLDAMTRTFDTHPEPRARIDRMDSVAVTRPREFEMLRSFRTVGFRIMTTVNTELSVVLNALPKPALTIAREIRGTFLDGHPLVLGGVRS
jgi:hypothetical protein